MPLSDCSQLQRLLPLRISIVFGLLSQSMPRPSRLFSLREARRHPRHNYTIAAPSTVCALENDLNDLNELNDGNPG